MGLKRTSCSTLARDDFIRVPSPAARISPFTEIFVVMSLCYGANGMKVKYNLYISIKRTPLPAFVKIFLWQLSDRGKVVRYF